MAATSDRRQAQMSIDLGDEQLLLERVRCSESLGQPFYMTVDIINTLGEVDLLPHLGKPVSAHVYEDDELMRHFNGLITDGEFLRETPIGMHYRLVARPFTYFLSQNRNMAIFQDKSVPDIIKKVLGDAGVTNFEFKTTRTYPPRTYCVQYRESDFAFISRLMEEEGIYYFFQHSADKHVMILCDAPSAHEPSTPSTLHYSTTAGSVVNVGSTERGGQHHMLEKLGERVSSGGEANVTLRSFDFEKPDRPLQAQSSDAQHHPNDNREVYDYPSHYVDAERGLGLSAVRLAALRRERQVYSGRSEATSLAVGTKLTVDRHPKSRFNQSYVISRTYHSIQSEQYRSDQADEHEREEDTHVAFEAIPATTQFHMPAVTPRPVVQGLESAIISGPDGEEIYTDEYGRVKVRFHWDRADTAGEKSTCWIRVAQFGGLGTVILPRVHQEVMVDFLHGDPDHPIVMGWVFNKSHMPVYDLPANKTRALWRTKRYGDTGQYPNAKDLDTGKPGVNELRFEDKGGHEEVFLHAERDMNTRIRFAESHHVGQTQQIKIGYDRTDDVGNDETTTVGQNQTLTVTGNQKETLKAKRTIDVTADDKLTVGQTQTIEIGTDLKITANKTITLTCGLSSIKMDAKSITISAPQVTMEGVGTAKVTSPMTTLEGTGMNTISGGVVMIN